MQGFKNLFQMLQRKQQENKNVDVRAWSAKPLALDKSEDVLSLPKGKWDDYENTATSTKIEDLQGNWSEMFCLKKKKSHYFTELQ